MFSNSFNTILAASAHQPFFQSGVIVVGTFILEDAATVLTAMRAEEGLIPMVYALGALFVGIVLGDLGLYGLGRLSAWTGWFQQFLPECRTLPARQWLDGRVGMAVFTSRFLPGMRLPTYTACGYLAVPFAPFVLASVVATLIWTTLLFGVSLSFGALIMKHLGEWRWLGVMAFTLSIILLGRFARRFYEVRR